MAKNQFTGPRAKLRAVRRHANEFREEMNRYIASNQTALKVEQYHPMNYLSLVAALAPIPEDVVVIVGDIAHQLRSALDVLACDLANWSGATNTSGVYFPIARTLEGYQDKRTTDKVKKLKPELRSIIDDEVKPYGKSVLVGLNAIANRDKHTGLISAIPSINQSEFNAFIPPGVSRTDPYFRKPSPLETGKIELIRIPHSTPMAAGHLKLHCNLIFTVDPIVGEPVSELLTDMARTVEGIVARFERHCFSETD